MWRRLLSFHVHPQVRTKCPSLLIVMLIVLWKNYCFWPTSTSGDVLLFLLLFTIFLFTSISFYLKESSSSLAISFSISRSFLLTLTLSFSLWQRIVIRKGHLISFSLLPHLITLLIFMNLTVSSLCRPSGLEGWVKDEVVGDVRDFKEEGYLWTCFFKEKYNDTCGKSAL